MSLLDTLFAAGAIAWMLLGVIYVFMSAASEMRLRNERDQAQDERQMRADLEERRLTRR